MLNGDGAHQISASGTPIGLVPGMQYSAERLAFPSGSRLLFYTDGLTEVFRGDDEFGTERLLQAFGQCNLNESDLILDVLWRELNDFCGGAHQEDDMTALALLRVQTKPGPHMVNLNGKPVELRVPSRMGYEKVAMGTAASVAKLMGFPDDRIEDLKTAIAEACLNAIEHGNQLNENLCVGVTLGP